MWVLLLLLLLFHFMFFLSLENGNSINLFFPKVFVFTFWGLNDLKVWSFRGEKSWNICVSTNFYKHLFVFFQTCVFLAHK